MPVNQQIEQLLLDAQTAFENARPPDVLSVLAPFGIEADFLDEGMALHDALRTEYATQQQEYEDVRTATATLRDRAQEVRTAFTRHRTLARTVFEPGTRGYRALQLSGTLGNGRRGASGWMQVARTFYTRLQDDDALLDALSIRGITEDAVQAQADALAALDDLEVDRQSEQGEAEEATERRNRVREDLKRHLRTLRDVVQVVADVEDRPQLPERLGFYAPS